jgi:nicotinate-nucleotide--dimethylbenzimidazole phosphoribosyltransferase
VTFKEAVTIIEEPDKQSMELASRHWDEVAKPLNSLGVLEEDIVRIAGAQKAPLPSLQNKWIAVMCSDNGIVEEGVTQTGQEVTAIVAKNMAVGKSCVCRMAACAGARVFPVDVGIAGSERVEGLLDRKVAAGTGNFLKGPAMSRAQAYRALDIGVEVAGILKEMGCCLAGSGEMGIGNTTTSSAVISVLLQKAPEEVTGRGAGLDSRGYKRKVQVIKEALAQLKPEIDDPVDVLSKVGGFDLAALTGFYIGCGAYRIPAVLDGLITGAAALAAVRLCPKVQGYLLASHVSAEPAGAMVLEALGLRPAIQAGLCLGEGTGAAALFPLLDMALAIYRDMGSFSDIKVQQYEHLM